MKSIFNHLTLHHIVETAHDHTDFWTFHLSVRHHGRLIGSETQTVTITFSEECVSLSYCGKFKFQLSCIYFI